MFGTFATRWILRIYPGLQFEQFASLRVTDPEWSSEFHKASLTCYSLHKRSRLLSFTTGLPSLSLRSQTVCQLLSEARVRCIIVGRLDLWKGQRVAVQAVGQLLSEGYAIALSVVGGPLFGKEAYEADLRSLIKDMNAQHSITLLGHRADAAALLKNADIAIHASTTPDPLPGVVLEAMAAGCAVVASAGGGVPEMIEDGVTGLLTPMGDAAALAASLRRLCDDPEFARSLADAGAAKVRKEFAIEQTGALLAEAWTQVAATNRRNIASWPWSRARAGAL